MCKIIITKHFRRQLKPYAKKYRNLSVDIKNILQSFNKKHAINLGSDLYKIRMQCASLPKGKNKSFRIIVYLIKTPKLLTPITIYFKSKKLNIKIQELKYHLRMSLNEIRQK